MSNLGISPSVSMNKLKSRILNPALTSIYSVLIGRPAQQSNAPKFNFPAFNQELLELTCVEASLPGSSLATIETNRDYQGIVERHAYSRLYDETIDFTFMVTLDSNYMQIRFFDYWMKYIVGEDVAENTLKKRTFNTRVKYPAYYQTDTLKIVKFEKDLGSGNARTGNILVYNFMQAFPKALNTINISYEGSQVLKSTVSFTYSRYFISELSSHADPNYVDPAQRNSQSPGNPEIPLGYNSNINFGLNSLFNNKNSGTFNFNNVASTADIFNTSSQFYTPTTFGAQPITVTPFGQ